MKLPTIRELLRQELQQDEKARKSAVHALIERIQAYPDRKMEVNFRIGGKFEGTHGGQTFDPHESTYLVQGITESDTKINLDQSVLVHSHLFDYGVQDGLFCIYIKFPFYFTPQLIPEYL